MMESIFSSHVVGVGFLSQSQHNTQMPDVEMNHLSSDSRYPKRKRQRISYNEGGSDDEGSDEDEDDFLPRKRTMIAKSSKPLPKHKIFPFMKLPAELRNKIYEMALLDSKTIHITSKTKAYRRVAVRCIPADCSPQYSRGGRWYHEDDDSNAENEEDTLEHRTFAPNLLAVSKTIHAEAASYLYTQPLALAGNNALLVFLNQIGSRHASMLREISIKEWCQSRSQTCVNFPAFSLLAKLAPNLERLIIACSLGYYGYRSWGRRKTEVPVRIARKVYRDCFPWLEAVGAKKGFPAAAVDMIDIVGENFDNKGDEAEMTLFRNELRRLLQ